MQVAGSSPLRRLTAAAMAAAAVLLGPPAPALARQETAASPQRIVEVVARRFAFEPARIEVDEGDRVRLIVRSVDARHGIAIDRFGVKQAVPAGGDPVTIDFVAAEAGTFPILCSEYCGAGHADMTGTLVVHARATGAAAKTEARAPDLDPDPAQPDFVVATVPTTLGLPRGKFAFRLTHRFTRPLGQGSVGDLAADFFGFDSGARMGVELRYGLFRGAQLAVARTSDRAIQLSGQYEVLSSRRGPVGVSIAAAVEGENNFAEAYSPGVRAIVSHRFGTRGAVYASPAWIRHAAAAHAGPGTGGHAAVIGLGARVRLGGGTYAIVEASPRLAGHAPGVTLASVGVEKRAGGHTFQINVSNGLSTTFAQTARGGLTYEDWHVGFNLLRKFY